jgi:hypothetical protein
LYQRRERPPRRRESVARCVGKSAIGELPTGEPLRQRRRADALDERAGALLRKLVGMRADEAQRTLPGARDRVRIDPRTAQDDAPPGAPPARAAAW